MLTPIILILLIINNIDNYDCEAGLGGVYPDTPIGKGGKRDDTSCVVGQVVEWTEAQRGRLSDSRAFSSLPLLFSSLLFSSLLFSSLLLAYRVLASLPLVLSCLTLPDSYCIINTVVSSSGFLFGDHLFKSERCRED